MLVHVLLNSLVQENKFVEERRAQLQSYLRHVVNWLLGKFPEFARNVSPSTVMLRIPLLSESPSPNSDDRSRADSLLDSHDLTPPTAPRSLPRTQSAARPSSALPGRGSGLASDSTASGARNNMGTIREVTESGEHDRPRNNTGLSATGRPTSTLTYSGL